ncbi:hypothetical protein WUBG_13904 [Wuchereria bancrofti]|uniref:Uncharacterized protein n=1 Tax=Wuchereria bancrofti TaxID=6293 RepID=J9DZD6_WUCBA|nr:hypothetical protein WUBG_13904 [Wuchereria bancrofti]
MTMKDWCERMSPRQYNVDERRAIQFGICHGFVRKLCIYPVSLKKCDMRSYFELQDFFPGECKIPVTDQTTIYLKLCPSFHGIEPPKVEPYMVPMFTQIPPPNTPNHIPKMDVLSQKICPKVDGVCCIKEIAMLVQIDTDLVMRCVRNLHFYGCLTLIPLFMYANTYVATEQLHDLYMNADLIETGMTMKDWCERMSPRQYNVDERRAIQFGICHGFVRKLCIYPVSLKKCDMRR